MHRFDVIANGISVVAMWIQTIYTVQAFQWEREMGISRTLVASRKV